MKIEDAVRILGSNLAERVVVRIARHEETSLPMMIQEEVSALLIRIADKQGWKEWPSNQVRN